MAARLAPPPAPPTFTKKVEVIRESHGAPLTPQSAAALVLKSPEGARAAATIRPVLKPERRVDLAPHKDAVGAPPADPVRAGGRALATADAPLIAHPSGGREVVAPVRVAPGAVVTAVPKAREEKKRDVAVAPGAVVTAVPKAREEKKRDVAVAPQPHPVQPQAIASSPAAQHPTAAPELRVQSQPVSRPPRRVVEPGPDPLAHEAPPAHVEVKQQPKPQQRQEVKPEKKNEGKPEKGNDKNPKEKPGKD